MVRPGYGAHVTAVLHVFVWLQEAKVGSTGTEWRRVFGCALRSILPSKGRARALSISGVWPDETNRLHIIIITTITTTIIILKHLLLIQCPFCVFSPGGARAGLGLGESAGAMLLWGAGRGSRAVEVATAWGCGGSRGVGGR